MPVPGRNGTCRCLVSEFRRNPQEFRRNAQPRGARRREGEDGRHREGARRSRGRGFVVEGGRSSTIPWRYLLTKKSRLRYIEYLLIVPLFVCPKFILPPTTTSDPPPLPRSELAHFNEVFLVFLGLSANQNPLPKTMPPRHPLAVPAPDPAFAH